MTMREQITERLLLVSFAAATLMAADLAVKATIPTSPYHFHQRSGAWEVLCIVLLIGAFALARIPSRAVAIGAGIMAGGVAGNLLSARANDNRVPNPLVLGDAMYGIAFNAADVFIVIGNLCLMVSLMVVTIRYRDHLIPPRRWARAIRRRFDTS